MNDFRTPVKAPERMYKKAQGRSNTESGKYAAQYLNIASVAAGPYVIKQLSLPREEAGVTPTERSFLNGFLGLSARNKEYISAVSSTGSSLGQMLFPTSATAAETGAWWGEALANSSTTLGKYAAGLGAIYLVQKTASAIQGKPEFEQAIASTGAIADTWSGLQGNSWSAQRGQEAMNAVRHDLEAEDEEEEDDYEQNKIGYEIDSRGRPISKAPIPMGPIVEGEFDIKKSKRHLHGGVGGSMDHHHGTSPSYYVGDYYPAALS